MRQCTQKEFLCQVNLRILVSTPLSGRSKLKFSRSLVVNLLLFNFVLPCVSKITRPRWGVGVLSPFFKLLKNTYWKRLWEIPF